jgi:ribonucleoside-triphosphate reductase
VNKLTLDYCTICNSKNVKHATRVIGYLKLIDNFSAERRVEEKMRYYHKI